MNRYLRFFSWMFYISMVFISFDCLEGKVLVITHSFNRPDFIEIHYKTFKKFLKDDYEYVVFNDAKDQKLCDDIVRKCAKLKIKCIRIPQHIHTSLEASVRTADAIQYSLEKLGFDHEGIVCIIDSDMFLIKDFSITNYLEDYQLAAAPQQRGHVYYMWNGLMFFNMNILPDKKQLNFNCGFIDGFLTDTGGATYFYFNEHPNLNFFKHNPDLTIREEDGLGTCNFPVEYDPEIDFKSIGHEHIMHWNGLSVEQEKFEGIRYLFNFHPDNIEFYLDHTFLHYRSGGNWDNKSSEYHNRKTLILNLFINHILR